jgi:hypothetical protein
MHHEHSGWNPLNSVHSHSHGEKGKDEKSKQKILVFGNPLVPQDSLALRILPSVRKKFPQIEFIELDGIDDLYEYGRNLTILDVAVGIRKVSIVDDLDDLELPRVLSMHDFDLAWNLKILLKAGMIDSVKIIAIPQRMDKKKALAGVEKILPTVLISST